MIRFVTLLILAAMIVAVGAVAVAVWSSGNRGGKLNGVQKVAYACLFFLMSGVAVGWLGAE
ncbi:hypothetical protein [Marinovum algicola]|jgi:NhaP-type Na+/H+ or K+/H+ antiporter|uniref:hypothetical protein n=1 Tax=Marinovum algicola TaxID=42444 RepID=UPI0024BB16D5|nr:hypothetical protein [Marinovum algicola]